ncbi:MAG: aromatic ring-hydroxylating dioxygenase subunit alpha [Simkaniaceae bacterium]|nr:aromatic ring-hydroxylating dioxygenase subunit alpha [Simkaniaceae bacterium]
MNNVQNFFPICVEAQLKKQPRAVELMGHPLVVFRDSQGSVRVLEDRCPHRGAPLSQGRVEGDCLVCPYHGWSFCGEGKCRAIPGLPDFTPRSIHGVKSFPVQVKYGLIWTSLEGGEIPQIYELGDAAYTTFLLESRVEVGMLDVIENALDPLHTHFVHSGWIRSDKSKRKPIQLEIENQERGIEVRCRMEAKQEGWIHRILSLGRRVEKNAGRFLAPNVIQLEYETSKKDHLLITGFILPVNEQCSSLYLVTAMKTKLPLVVFRPLTRFLFRIAMKQDEDILNRIAAHRKKSNSKHPFVSTRADFIGMEVKKLLEGKKLTQKTREITLYV